MAVDQYNFGVLGRAVVEGVQSRSGCRLSAETKAHQLGRRGLKGELLVVVVAKRLSAETMPS